MRTNDLIQELSSNFIEYAAAVNGDRAIPDARSGLKPVARRILYGAFEGGKLSNKPYVKCAQIVGEVMGKLHPHGDSSIYGALVRLAQPWVMRYPLIDFHGNMGNVGGDGPASYRYTEARLSPLSEKGLLTGLKKNSVDFMPTYDDKGSEPITLPSIFPNLLCNPNAGIGVAMACSWAPHNLKEVATAINDFLDGKEPMLPGPDFPTGGLIINKNDIPTIMKTGHGSVKVRGKYNIEKNNIVFYEIPYGVQTEALLTEIGTLADNKEIEGISDLRDESNKKGMRIVIECDKNANMGSIINQLFRKTNLQSSFSYNQVALVDKTPVELNLKDCVEIYVKHNIECIFNEAEFDRDKAKDRLEIVDGLLKALEDIDNIIQKIKQSESASAAKERLQKDYGFTENQAKAILDMKLAKLAKLEKIELENEKAELEKLINELEYLMTHESALKEELKDRLSAIVKKYGDERRTELTHIEIKPEEKEIEEVVPEDCVVVLSQTGEIKRIPLKSFRIQRKNGKGIKTADEAILNTISTNTIDTLMAFTDKGKMYRLLVDHVPVGTNASKGVRIDSLISMEPKEKVIAITSLNRKSDAEYVIFVTKEGLVKKTLLEEYTKTKRNSGISAIKLKESDSIANVVFTKDEDMILITHKGMSIKFNTKDISPIGRVAMGVKGIKLNEGDFVIGGFPITKLDDYIAIVTENGFGKRSPVSDFSIQGRGGKGCYIYKPTTITGDIIGVALVSNEDSLLLVGKPNSICISAKDVPILTKASMGNTMIKESKVTSVIKL